MAPIHQFLKMFMLYYIDKTTDNSEKCSNVNNHLPEWDIKITLYDKLKMEKKNPNIYQVRYYSSLYNVTIAVNYNYDLSSIYFSILLTLCY